MMMELFLAGKNTHKRATGHTNFEEDWTNTHKETKQPTTASETQLFEGKHDRNPLNPSGMAQPGEERKPYNSIQAKEKIPEGPPEERHARGEQKHTNFTPIGDIKILTSESARQTNTNPDADPIDTQHKEREDIPEVKSRTKEPPDRYMELSLTGGLQQRQIKPDSRSTRQRLRNPKTRSRTRYRRRCHRRR